MKRTFHFLLGYAVGITVFFLLIPYLFFELSKLDYIFNYRMIIGSMVIRLAVSGVLLIIGLIFVLWSNLFLFRVGKGGPAEGLGMAFSPKTKKLVISGPYKYCRNPMVFGAFTVYLGLVIYLNSITGLIFLIIMLAFGTFYLKKSEEKRLLVDFGSDYEEYRKNVPMIFPRRRYRKSEL